MNYERTRLLGSCVLGTLFALLPALVISILTERNGSFAVSFVVFAIFLSILVEWVFTQTADKPLRRTPTEVIKILESAVASGGDERFDDFLSSKIADPKLDLIRQKCLEVTLAPNDIFDKTLRQLLAELQRDSNLEPR